MVLGNAGQPEDIEETADVFAAIWRRIDRYDPSRFPFYSWGAVWVLILAKSWRWTVVDSWGCSSAGGKRGRLRIPLPRLAMGKAVVLE